MSWLVLRSAAQLMLDELDGNPYEDLGLFQDEGRHLSAIMKGGRFYKNRLAQ